MLSLGGLTCLGTWSTALPVREVQRGPYSELEGGLHLVVREGLTAPIPLVLSQCRRAGVLPLQSDDHWWNH